MSRVWDCLRLTLVVSKPTFPSLPFLPKEEPVLLGETREKEPMESSRESLRVWPWPSHLLQAEIWSRLRDPLWPGSPWLSLPSWPCCVLSWAFGPKATCPWVKLQDCPVWKLLVPAHHVPILMNRARTSLFCLLSLSLVMTAKVNPQSVLSNLKGDLYILKDVFFLRNFFPYKMLKSILSLVHLI